MSNQEQLFAAITPSEEASLSGGSYYRRRRRRPASAEATADATASGRNVFTDSFTNAEVDRFGNARAESSSTSVARG